MPIYDELPSSLRERTLICLGRFIADWANCESSFSWIFSRVIGADLIKSDIIWLSINSTAARMDLLCTLLKVEPKLTPTTRVEIENCAKEFRVVTELRNYYCHAVYVTDDDMNLTSVDKWRLAKLGHADAVKGKTRPISEEHIRELCSGIDQSSVINRRIIQIVPNLEPEMSVGAPVARRAADVHTHDAL